MSTGDEDDVSSAIEWSVDEPPSPSTAGRTDQAATSAHLQSVLAHQFAAIQSEQELLAVDEIKDKVKLLDHQLTAAHQAITSMGRGTLFADEVGLGKTIEVGMVLKEMDLRETHNTFLVLTPAQLAPQWQTEMAEKFNLNFVCNYDDEFEGFTAHDRIIASVDTAKSARFREAVLSRQWDVLVLDEAHYVRNEGTKRYELLKQIEYQEGFFATATPIQNEITDLYNIIDLIRPGLLGTRSEFKSRFMVDGEGTQIKNADDLQRKLNRVMIRNQREETDIDFTNRNVRTNTFEPVAAEDKLYDAVTEYVRANYSSQDAKHLVLLLLQKEVVSSPSAVLGTINKWLRGDGAATLSKKEKEQLREIKALAEAVDTTTKQERLREVIETVHDRLEETRLVVFTQFRPTQEEIAASARALDQPVHVVNGDLSSVEKEAVVAEFEQDGGVLVATDAISEGRNMQFCNVMVNYDLPWNPMKVEQRIGRIDRIGQEREVHVFNLALSGTVEEHVLEKLYSKINLFTQSVGGLREILSRMEKSGTDFEKEVFDRLRTADDHVEMENNFDEMAVDLESNHEAAERMGDFNNEVFSPFELGGEAK